MNIYQRIVLIIVSIAVRLENYLNKKSLIVTMTNPKINIFIARG